MIDRLEQRILGSLREEVAVILSKQIEEDLEILRNMQESLANQNLSKVIETYQGLDDQNLINFGSADYSSDKKSKTYLPIANPEFSIKKIRMEDAWDMFD